MTSMCTQITFVFVNANQGTIYHRILVSSKSRPTLAVMPSRFIDTNGVLWTLMNTGSKSTFVNVILAFRAFKARRTGTMVRTIANASIFTAGFANSWNIKMKVKLGKIPKILNKTHDNSEFRFRQSHGCIRTGNYRVPRNGKWHWSDKSGYQWGTGWLAYMTNPRHPFEILQRIHLKQEKSVTLEKCILFCRVAWLHTLCFPFPISQNESVTR